MNTTDHSHPVFPLATEYFDGQRPVAQAVTLRIDNGDLLIDGPGVSRRVPRRQLRWPERQRHGARMMYLPQHGLISHADGAGWDAWTRAQGLRDPWFVRWTHSWRGVMWVLLICAAMAWATWEWGVPRLSRAVVAAIPDSVDKSIGEQVLASFDGERLAPTQLSIERQAAIRQAFAAAVEKAYPKPDRPAFTLHFRSAGRMKIGPNAFALPGGVMVLTDELAELLADAPDATIGVLAHELGHVRHRHGMRTVVQTSLLAGLSGLALGDFSGVLAAVPVVLGRQPYVRDFERQADQEAIQVLRANGIRPSRMVVAFDRVDEWRKREGQQASNDLPIALASHPPDAERIRVFREADAER